MTAGKLRRRSKPPAPAGSRLFNEMRKRLEAGWKPDTGSADSIVMRFAAEARNKARDLALANGYVEGYLTILETQVVGPGTGLQAQVKMQRGNKLDQRTNDLIESKWKDWGKARYCHTAGELSYKQIERLVVRSLAASGEVFLRLVNQPFGGSKVPLAIEVLEADMLDLEYNQALQGGNTIRMGIERDTWGRAIAYHFWNRHPGDNTNVSMNFRERTRIPAEDVIHIYLPKRPGQTRGMSWFAPVVGKLFDANEFEKATATRQRLIASLMGFVESPDGELQGDEETEFEMLYDFEPGVFKYLAPGEKITFPDFKGDNNPDPFLNAQLRGAARGVGASYETFSGNYSEGSYSSARQSILPERDWWRTLQELLIERFHQPVYERWLQQAVLANVLPLRDYAMNPERYTDVLWTPRGWKWIDPTKEMAAAILALENNLTSQTEIIQENGGDIEKVLQTRKREQELAQELGLTSTPASESTEPTDSMDSGSGEPGQNSDPAGGAGDDSSPGDPSTKGED